MFDKYDLITSFYVSKRSLLRYLLRALQALAVGAAEHNAPSTTRVMLDHHPAIRMAYQRPLLFNSEPVHCVTWRFLPGMA
jgi:hypothetical protein